MTLAAGNRLGPYEIAAKLGEGGMGEVYRAVDSRLGREVAIKVLPERLAADADALARFEREARAVAALSHPNILAIFDLGRDGATAYAAMELLDGETLRARFEGGALPVRKALEIAAQVANGLAAAHERGIVHRDLKPENLFLTRDSQVKILDFGLARQEVGAGSKSQVIAAPTQTSAAPGTSPGTVLGTVGYMSPEQVRGEPADHRSDLFSLGVVLYEALAGRRAFARGSSVETMSAILRDEPPEIDTLGERIPPAVVRLLQHCLEKRPEERFQSARDLAFDLRSLATGGSVSGRSGVAAEPAMRRPPAARWRIVAGALLWLAAGALGGYLASPRTSSSATVGGGGLRPTFRQLTKLPGGEGTPTVAPDGESFVYAKRDGGDLDLFVQRIDGSKAIALTPDCEQDDYDPAISPDGRTIAFRSECGAGVFVMGATGESRRRVADFGYDPEWSPDGRELAVVTERLDAPTSRNSTSHLWAVKIESGERRHVSEHDAMGPTWSPDGRRIAFWGLKGDSFQRDLWSVPADGSASSAGAATAIVDDAALDWAPVYSRDGRWLYFVSTRGGTFNYWRFRIDPATGDPAGEAEPVTAPTSWGGAFALSADGRRMVFADQNLETAIQRAPFDAGRLSLASPPVVALSGSFVVREQKLSADGEWIVFSNEDLPQQLHIVRPDGTGYRQLTEGDRNRQGDLSPDGAWIAFQTSRGDSSLAVIRVDGGGWQSIPVGFGYSNPRWSPDGRTLATFSNSRNGGIIDVGAGFAAAKLRDLPLISDGVQFWPVDWSTDGDLLAGWTVRAGQIGAIVLFDLASSTYRQLTEDRGSANEYRSMTFVDRRLLVYFADSTLWLRDVDRGEPRRIHSAPPGREIDNLSASLDGRWLTWIERADESDIWLATLEEPGGPGGATAGAKP